jgi:hypothetical protein
VNDRQVRLRWREAEDPLKLLGSVGIDLRGEPGLGEAETGEPQQGVIAVDAALEQRAERPGARGHWFS